MSPRARRATLVPILAVVFAISACSGPAAPAVAPVASAAGGASAPPSGVSSPPDFTSTTPTLRPTGAPTPSPLQALTLLWQKAEPDKIETETYWPTINPITGDIWVSDGWDNQYWIFKSDGKFLEAWGRPGKGPGQFKLTTNDPNPDGVGAIAFAPDGSFYVADNGNDRVEKFDKNRRFVTTWGSFGTGDGQFASPKGIATDGKTVWVADDPRGDIQAFDLNGKYLRSFPFPFVLFSLTPSGNLIVGDQTGVLEVNGTGNQVAHFDLDYGALGGNPGQVVVDEAGHIFVPLQADSGPVGLVELNPDGSILRQWSTGGETMTLSPDGSAVYFAYTGPSSDGLGGIRKYAIPKG